MDKISARLSDDGGYSTGLEDVQRATLNILEDFNFEKQRLEDVQRASLNILEDFEGEKHRLQEVQQATLNILDDFNAEKIRMEEGQRALLNILDDFDAERAKVIAVNQQLETANKELDAFSYSVSHDLRAPLRAVDGFSQILMEEYPDRLDAQGRHYLERVRVGAQHMARLIDDLLNLSRVTRTEMNPELVDLSTIAESVAEDLRSAEPDRRVEVAVQPGLQVEGDAKMLRIVLTNLLSNAWKFTGRQPGARIELGVRDIDGARAFYVRDNGVGFDMTYAGKLFGAFQRLHATNEFPGTGIGLATVQRIIHRHGGRIWAEGAVEQGATVYFTLG